ncbi:hypothetical protein Pcinc_039922 [Petrolisthes cinctipes]|uniref:Uncharacterized protein n=1 Tax=Petrolisthes cinctipes TaxID=88211 RepID=A0AAE1EIL6_PETCI|nr:hypothetical protein Pcinc_039922 [Petrolisthes cinctipes]
MHEGGIRENTYVLEKNWEVVRENIKMREPEGQISLHPTCPTCHILPNCPTCHILPVLPTTFYLSYLLHSTCPTCHILPVLPNSSNFPELFIHPTLSLALPYSFSGYDLKYDPSPLSTTHLIHSYPRYGHQTTREGVSVPLECCHRHRSPNLFTPVANCVQLGNSQLSLTGSLGGV